MEWEKLKNMASMPKTFGNVTCDIEMVDGVFQSLTLTDHKGNLIKVARSGYDIINLMIPKMDTHVIMVAQVKDGENTFEFKDSYDDRHMAELAHSAMLEKYDNVDSLIDEVHLPSGTDIKKWLNKK